MLTIVTIVLYLIGSALFWRRIKGFDPLSQRKGGVEQQDRWLYISLAIVLSVLHGYLLKSGLVDGGNINLALGNIFSLVCLMTMLTFAVGALFRSIVNLGIFVLPIGLAGLLAGSYARGPALVLEQAPSSLWIHLSIAILAFGFLCMASVQAILLFIQERQLQSPRSGSLFPALPAIQTMETNMVLLTIFGVILLTINVVTGVFSSWQVHGKTIELNHHILLSIMAWICFAGILVGRRLFGWRGQVAAKWTLFAFILLVLAYFGTRVVTSIILA